MPHLHALSLPATLLATAALAFVPASGDSGSQATESSGDSESSGSTSETGGEAPVPANADELQPWLEAESYAGWPAQPGISDGTAGSSHGRVRILLNPLLDESLAAQNESHPAGAAAVKELYDELDARVGWAVAVKTDADSDGGNGWYWFEKVEETVTADGNGAGACINCHAAGADFVRVDYPLE